MRSYVARRLLLVPVTVVLLSIFVFAMLRAVPGSAVDTKLENNYTPEQAEELRALYGFDQPIYEQFGRWVWRIAQGDLGKSIITARSIGEEFTRRLPVTAELLILTMLIQVPLGVGLGVISATRQDKLEDYGLRFGAIMLLAIPNFWLATMTVIIPLLLFSVALPVGYSQLWNDPLRNLTQMIVPAAVSGGAGSAILMRVTRSYLLEVLRQDYVRTARAKGLEERAVVIRHALRNAFIPVITIIGLSFASGFGGSVIVEQIYSLPGLGQYIINALLLRDYPVIQLFVIFFGALFVLVNLTVDMSYAWLDPRVRVS